MAEELLDHSYVGAVVEHVGGAGVAKDVWAEPITQTHPVAVAPDHPPGSLA